MSEINATRLASAGAFFLPTVYVGDDASLTLIRGERWTQHPSNDIKFVFMCCVLAFAEYLAH